MTVQNFDHRASKSISSNVIRAQLSKLFKKENFQRMLSDILLHHSISTLVELTFIGLYSTIDLCCGNRTVKFASELDLLKKTFKKFNLFFNTQSQKISPESP